MLIERPDRMRLRRGTLNGTAFRMAVQDCLRGEGFSDELAPDRIMPSASWTAITVNIGSKRVSASHVHEGYFPVTPLVPRLVMRNLR